MISNNAKPKEKEGTERFHFNGDVLNFSIMDFWRWSVSDLLSNATRGRLAEFIVASALQIPFTKIREEWAAWDLTTPEGIKVEVKSAAYLQSWHQKEYSRISFQIRKTRAWDSESNIQADFSQHHADIYVFALLAHKDEISIDPMNLSQWFFYILPTIELDHRKRSQNSITLVSLEKLCKPIRYESIRFEALSAFDRQQSLVQNTYK